MSPYRRLLSMVGLLVCGLALLIAAPAALGRSLGNANSVRYLQTIHLPPAGTPVPGGVSQGDPARGDIQWVDQHTGRLYFADGTNNAVDVFNAWTDTFLGFVGQGLFHGGDPACVALNGAVDCLAPNGVLTDRWGRVWVGDSSGGPDVGGRPTMLSSVKVLDPNPGCTLHCVSTITLGGLGRSDEMAYDPRDGVVLIANPAVTDHFVSWVDARTLTVLGKYTFPSTIGGIEQSVWDPRTGNFYLAVPGTNLSTNPGRIVSFNPLTPGAAPTTLATIPGCVGVNGLVLAKHPSRLFAACDNGIAVVNVHTGQVTIITGSGLGSGDEIWFNPGDDNVYAPTGFTGNNGLNVIDATTLLVGRPLPDPFAAVGPPLIHSVAAYEGNNHIFVAEECAPPLGFKCSNAAGNGYGISVYVSHPRGRLYGNYSHQQPSHRRRHHHGHHSSR